MQDDSQFISPLVKAVLEVLKRAGKYLPNDHDSEVVIVGYKGFEGRKIYRVLKEMGYKVSGIARNTKDFESKIESADLIISATGVAGLIKAKMVKKGSVLIDIGFPGGDIEKEAYKKASFVSPVPGGVGPMTIICLLENLIDNLLERG